MTTDAAPPVRIPGPFSALGIRIVCATIVVDQVSKHLAESLLGYGEAHPLLPILSLLRVHNTGIAFSLGDEASSLFLIAATLAITIAVFFIWRGASEGGRLATAGFALILGGAIGNLADRILYGHVIDFLYLHLGPRGLFVFNLADVALTIGPALLAFVYLFGGRKAAA